MNQQTAAHKLADILTWRNHQWTPQTSLRSPRLDENRGGNGEGTLPFPADDLTRGARGVETYDGVTQWLRGTAAWLEFWTGQPVKGDAGAYLLDQLENNPDLAGADVEPAKPGEDAPSEQETTYQQMFTFWEEWNQFTSELNTMWNRVGNATGYRPQRRTICPACKQGWQTSTPTNQGVTDKSTCTNPTCETVIDWSDGEISASIRATLRDPNIADTIYLPWADIHTIWGTMVKAGTLRRWVHEGHVRKENNRYNLADINTKKADNQ